MTISSRNGKETTVALRGINGDEVDAFVLTFRFFIQNNENTSFQSLCNIVSGDPSLSSTFKNEILKVRTEFNEYLDLHPSVNLILNNEKITPKRIILDTFIYGDLAHANKQYRETMQKWKQNDTFFSVLYLEFGYILAESLAAIAYISQLAKEELAKIN